ncbi:hypothetical protein [Novosphingobium soli]|uniref:Uncharacterized protein n=1 Tax=Novosphingobium soli TaxID=574956 RepID=A0ABV6CT25_9SPHN
MSTQSRVALYLRVSEVGTAAIVGLCLGRVLEWPHGVQIAFTLALIGALAFLFVRRLRDEYMQDLWFRSASAAFLGMILVGVFLEFLRGIIDGASGAPPRPEGFGGISAADAAQLAGLLIFFVAFQVTRLRGR